VAATAVGGLLAGANVDRLVVPLPARRRVGALAWAASSRHADLGNRRILYPSLGIGGAALTAAAVAGPLDRTASGRAAEPLYAAATLAVRGRHATTRAVPSMLSLRDIGDDPTRSPLKVRKEIGRWSVSTAPSDGPGHPRGRSSATSG
jgi:hypothetical protein